jgi:plastocyanin
MRRRVTLSVCVLGVALTALGCSGRSHATAATCASELHAIAPVTNRGSRTATGATISLDAASAAFAPTCVTGVPHGVVELSVRNTGRVVHNIEIVAQHIDVDVAPSRTLRVRVRVGDQPIVYVCKIHRDLGMVGVLIPTGE